MLAGHFSFENVFAFVCSVINLAIGIAIVRRPREVAKFFRGFGRDRWRRASDLELRHEVWITATAGVIAILIALLLGWVSLATELTSTPPA